VTVRNVTHSNAFKVNWTEVSFQGVDCEECDTFKCFQSKLNWTEFPGRWLWGMSYSGMWYRVALVKTDVSKERIASNIRVERIGELETTLLVTAKVVTSSLILSTTHKITFLRMTDVYRLTVVSVGVYVVFSCGMQTHITMKTNIMYRGKGSYSAHTTQYPFHLKWTRKERQQDGQSTHQQFSTKVETSSGHNTARPMGRQIYGLLTWVTGCCSTYMRTVWCTGIWNLRICCTNRNARSHTWSWPISASARSYIAGTSPWTLSVELLATVVSPAYGDRFAYKVEFWQENTIFLDQKLASSTFTENRQQLFEFFLLSEVVYPLFIAVVKNSTLARLFREHRYYK
jgi:hypothetical protein